MSTKERMQNAAGAMNEESSRMTEGTPMLDTSDPEDDMHAQLDDQINRITMLTESFNNETSPPMVRSVTDADMGKPRTRRSLRSRSNSVQHGGQTEMPSNKKGKSALSFDKNPRLSPLAARAALAAAVPMKPVLPQVKKASLLASEAVQSQSSHDRPDSRPTTATPKRETKKTRKDPKTQVITRRVKTRGYNQMLHTSIDV